MSIGSEEREYPQNDIDIIKLEDSTKNLVNDFKCAIAEIEDFLKEDALHQYNEGVNKTYLWISKKDKRVISYITLCVDAIHLDRIKKEEMAKHNIKYKSLPALKICRMGVRTGLTGKGIGKKMIAFTVRQALKIHEKAACRFITLDSKNDESLPKRLKPIRFYKKMA